MKEMLSATRNGAPVFVKKIDNSGVHDTRVINRDTLARVRPNKRETVFIVVIFTSFDRSIIFPFRV